MVKKSKIDNTRVRNIGIGLKLASRKLDGGVRKWGGKEVEFMGIKAWEALDPYTEQERNEFRLAMKNPYVKRACRIQSNYTVGQGYTTQAVPRDEEELPEEQQTMFEQTKIYVPLFDDEFTPDEIKDKIDKMMIKMDLQTVVFNAHYTSLQQGRCVVAMTPLYTNDGMWSLPQQLRFIRPEHTLRPVIDQETGELRGVRLIGVESDNRDNILDSERMMYFMNGFNNVLFADFYGDSKVADIADIASNLNVVLNEDYEQAALHSWFTAPVYSVPVPPQEYGNEENILNAFLDNISDSKGQITAVTSSSDPNEKGVEIINNSTNSGNIAGLDIIRLGLIKAIIAHFGIPGFMISEGDVGQLGGNTNISEMDNYLSTEITPDREYVQTLIENQLYDRILCILWKTNDISYVPIKIKHKFNKPQLFTMIQPDQYKIMTDLLEKGIITPDGFRERLGLDQFSADKKTAKGADPSPDENKNRKKWINDLWNKTEKSTSQEWPINNDNKWDNKTEYWRSPIGDKKWH